MTEVGIGRQERRLLWCDVRGSNWDLDVYIADNLKDLSSESMKVNRASDGLDYRLCSLRQLGTVAPLTPDVLRLRRPPREGRHPAGGPCVVASCCMTAARRLRVFLSYTTELHDFPSPGTTFVDAARSAIRACNCDWIDMDDFGADPRPSVEVCKERVRECDVWIGLLGFRYGDRCADGRSFVEVEYGAAEQTDRLAFLWTKLDTNQVPYERIRPGQEIELQEAFRNRLQSSVTSASFANAEALYRQVGDALRPLVPSEAPASPDWFEAIEIDETRTFPPEPVDLAQQSELAVTGLPEACTRMSRLLGHLERRAQLPMGIDRWPASDQIAVARRTVLSMVPMADRLSEVLTEVDGQVADSDALIAQALVERPELLRETVVEIHGQLGLTRTRLIALLTDVNSRPSRDWVPMRAQLEDIAYRLASLDDVVATWLAVIT